MSSPVTTFAESLQTAPLVCPDDRTQLLLAEGHLSCPRCLALFPTFADRLVDVLPARRVALDGDLAASYEEDYARQSMPRLSMDLEPWAWGTRSVHSAKEVERRNRMVAWIRTQVAGADDADRAVLCDVSAGAGHYSLACADAFRLVLHCDLVPNALVYAFKRAAAAGAGNVLFVRHDYLQSPLDQTADVVICMDSLIRGHNHEVALLRTIHTALKPGGHAIVDFANLRRQYVRRALQPRRRLSTDTRAYRAHDARALLREAGFDGGELLRLPSSRLEPLPRLVFRVRKSDEGTSQASDT